MSYNPWKVALLENGQFSEYSGKSGLCEAKRAAEEYNGDVRVGGHEGQIEMASGVSSRHIAEMQFGDRIYWSQGSRDEKPATRFTFNGRLSAVLSSVGGSRPPQGTMKA